MHGKIAQFFARPAAQQCRLHQDRRPCTEPGAHGRDVGDARRVGQCVFGNFPQRGRTVWRPEEDDVVGAEGETGGTPVQEGLTPVTMTL
ncbi:hypothetical protein MBOU_15610 [Mycobacterium bourgelatii]|uniref:Uncharacterized protein n=1 Tax=Mycobacterium bourgelatii TaxID=1273442 RepID=A0A7I9YLK4_MYCBU|nr:hypothetical protein MBOU_15610 [Mycobacterium bourgelatii]